MDRQPLIDALNEDLAGELQAITMYITYGATVAGPHRLALRQFFLSEIADETGHAQFLADKVAALGGQPTTVPRPVPAATSPHDMLQNVLEAEKKAIHDYNRRAEQAREYGDIALATHLETMIEDETGHYEETLKILRGWE